MHTIALLNDARVAFQNASATFRRDPSSDNLEILIAIGRRLIRLKEQQRQERRELRQL